MLHKFWLRVTVQLFLKNTLVKCNSLIRPRIDSRAVSATYVKLEPFRKTLIFHKNKPELGF